LPFRSPSSTSDIVGDTGSVIHGNQLDVALEEEIVRRMQDNVFVMHKDPAAFVATIMRAARDNLTQTAVNTPNQYFIGDARLPVTGLIVLTKRGMDNLCKVLDCAHNAARLGLPAFNSVSGIAIDTLYCVDKPIYYKPISNLNAVAFANTGVVETFDPEDDPGMPDGDVASLIDALEIAMQLDRPAPRSVLANKDNNMRMTQLGEALLSRSDVPALYERRRAILHTVDVLHKQCPFVTTFDTDGTVSGVIITCYPHDEHNSLHLDPTGASPSGQCQEKIMFHACVGEIRPGGGDEWHQWPERISEEAGIRPAKTGEMRATTSKDVRSAVMTPDTVTVYTGADMQHGVLTVSNAVQCLMYANPDMWDPTDALRALNDNYQTYVTLAHPNLRSSDTYALTATLQEKVKLARERDEKLPALAARLGPQKWFRDQTGGPLDQDLLALRKIEIYPMHDLIWRDNAFAMRRRHARHNFLTMGGRVRVIRRLQALLHVPHEMGQEIAQLVTACQNIRLPANFEAANIPDEENFQN
jgi:hypothetical protein